MAQFHTQLHNQIRNIDQFHGREEQAMVANWNPRFVSKLICLVLTCVAATLMLTAGAARAVGQACPAQNWAGSTPNIWAATVSDLVMLNNNPATNQPTIPTMLYDGTYSPWGYSQHPEPVTQLNTNWSCPSGTPVISIAGAGRETVAFQLFITAPTATALSDVSVTITPLTGPGTTFTSDNTGNSKVTRYLEGYVPYSCAGATSIGCVQATGSIPDPLIPFYDPYDAGNPAVATPFNVQAGTTQGVWVDITIPASQTAGTYTGTLTVSGTGIATTTLPVTLTVWNGNLPGFDAGSTNSTYADMLKVWLPLYQSSLDSGEGISGSDIPLFQQYQVMAHNYDVDTQFDPFAPAISGAYPSTNPTTFTVSGGSSASTIDWTTYDSYFNASLTPGSLFADGTAMRVLDTPIANGGAGAWTYPAGYSWCMYNCADAPLMPAGLVSLTQNYATQISQHFSSNHTSKSWAIPDLMSYTFDENYNNHSYQLGDQPLMYQIMSQVMQALNASNSSLSPTWAANTAPIRPLTTDEPACMEDGDTTYYTASACADHINLSYPGGTNATPGYSTSWVTTWSPNPGIYMTGQPGPALSYGVDPTIIAGTGYQFTLDLTQGVPALSTAPAPIERWTYNNGGGGSGGVNRRVAYWTAYKYGQDETIPSVGDPSPAAPAPGGLWSWIGNFWGGYNGTASASSCNSLSPFVENGDDQGDSYFFPGNELGCYYTANPVGEAVLTANPAVNTTCTANGYSVCNGISGPIATRELEQWRRGYEDYEYLYLYGKQAGRAAAESVVASVAAEGMSDWENYDWENIDGGWYEYGVTPVGTAYTGNCTYPSPIDSPIFGDLPNGLPNGPTGQGSSGSSLNYDACEGLWSPDPYAYESARIQLAEALGFAPATTPSISSLSPSSGSNQGGTSVTINGADFSGATAVEFGGVPATSFTVNSSTKITAIAPAGNGTVTVEVFGTGGVSPSTANDLFTNISPVTVTGLSPASGVEVGGNSVNITGTDFSTGAIVMFGSAAATHVVVNSATSITATAPAGTGTVFVTATAALGTSATGPSNEYTYLPPPTVTSISPNSGTIPGGTSVTLGGTGFASGMTVDFGTNAATSVVVSSSTSATATSPAGSSMSGGVVDVTVTTVDGTSPVNQGDEFNYTSPVTVTNLSVRTGPPGGGTSVVITGTDFTGATAVKFGADAATSFTVNSSTQITATSPAGGGTVDITVTTPPYSSAATRADQFSYTSAIQTGVFSVLPTTAVGSTSSAQNVSIKLQSASAISSITVPVAQNGQQEFIVGTVTGCTIGGASNPANTTCTVPITFKPQYPGVRMGTLTVNNAGDVIGTAGLAGIGQGPELAVTPGSLAISVGGGAIGVTATPQSVSTAALSVSNNGSALAMDGAGNLYIADDINCMAYKVTATTNQIVAIAGNYTFASGAVTPSTTPEPALNSNTCPQGIAVDGAGNVYIIDANTLNSSGYPNAVEEVSAATGEIFVMAGGGSVVPTTTPEAATSALLNAVNSLATDSAGNLYIADFYNNQVEKVTPAGQIVVVAGGGSTQPSSTPVAAISAQLSGPTGMVVDDAGNLYISDQNISVIDKVNASGQITAIAGGGVNSPSTTPQAATTVALNNPAALAVDGAGNLYIADYSNDLVEQVNLAGQLVVVAGGGVNAPTSTGQPSTSAGLGLIQGIEVDGAGNLYIADGTDVGNGDNVVEKVTALGVGLKFPFTDVGSSSLAQTLHLNNIGNQTLTFSSLSATTDFPLQTSGTCTLSPTSGESLATSANCSVTYLFHPTQGGVLNESATLTDNNLNGSSAQQGLPFTGTGVGGTNPQLTTINPPSGGSGTLVTLTGTNLSGATEVTFGTTQVTPASDSSTTVTANAPSGTGTVNVTVTTSNGTSNAESFTYTGTPAATPTFSPAAGTYTTAQTVTISDTTSGATIYYTTNGSTPTTSSTVYTGTITVSTPETVKAIATASGYTQSAVGSATYVFNAATPTFSPGAGTYNTSQTVTISDTTPSSTIYYTTNGTTPTTSSTVYSGPITVSAAETVKAIATASGHSQSAVGSAAYAFTVATPTFSPGAGTYNTTQTVTLSSATPSTTIYYTTNGTTPTTSSTLYSGPISVAAAETVKALAVKTGYTNSAVGSAAYAFTVSTPTFSPAAGSYHSSQTVAIGSTTPSTTIYYTTNGTTPTTSSTLYSAPITVNASETVKALAVKTGYTNSAVGSAAYSFTVATPTFSPAAGTYTSAQSVTISTATPSATIYYTTNGSTPTTSSTLYSAPVVVSISETVKALAVLTGYTNSAVGSAAYTISLPVIATPTFSPAAGTYGSTQNVSISDSTVGTRIYYTTNGSTPTTTSTLYTTPVSVSVSETVKAIAVPGQNAANSDFATNPPMTPGAGTYIYDPTNVSGWTFSGPTQNASSGSYGSGVAENGSAWGWTAAPDGANQVAFLQDNATLTQTLTGLTVGNQYTVSFYLEGRPGYSANPITATIAGATLLSTTTPAGGSWTQYTEQFTATATSEALTFTTTQTTGDYDTGVSDVTVTESGNLSSAVGSAAYTINLAPTIRTLAGVQGSTTAPTSGMVAHGGSIGAPVGVAIAPIIGGAGGDIYFDVCSTAWNCSYNFSLYVIYEGGAAAKAILVANGITSPVIGDVYPVNSQNETGPASLSGLFVDAYGNVFVADWSYSRVYLFYPGEVAGQGTNPADALLNADPAAWVVGYGLHAGYSYHVADGSAVVGNASTNPTPHAVWVDSAENVFFTDYSSNDIEVVYNTSGTSANTILTAEGYTSLKQGYTYMIAGGQSVSTYPYDNDGGSSVAYNGATSTANTATNGPFGLYGDSSGNIYFTDNTSNKIKKLSGTTAVLSTIGGPAAGTATTVGHGGDGGPATSAQMNGPIGIVLNSGGNVYFADSANSSVRMISGGNISTVAGTGGTSGSYSGEGGPATSAVMNTTFHLSIDAIGNLYVADEANDLIHTF
jgi:Chitobiase/beta-hexosaminidase C-terminal domain/IPT/TIG domain/Family of unknown function (DUF6067)